MKHIQFIIAVLFNILSLYFSFWILDKVIFPLQEFWLIFPTWVIFALFMVGLNIFVWTFKKDAVYMEDVSLVKDEEVKE